MKALKDTKDPIFTAEERKGWTEAGDRAKQLSDSVQRYRPMAYSVSDVTPPQVPTLAETYVLAGGELADKGEEAETGILRTVTGNTEAAEIPFARGGIRRPRALTSGVASPDGSTPRPPVQDRTL